MYTCDVLSGQRKHGLNTFLYTHLCNFLSRSSANFCKRSIHASLLLLPLLLPLLRLLQLLLLWLLTGRQKKH